MYVCMYDKTLPVCVYVCGIRPEKKWSACLLCTCLTIFFPPSLKGGRTVLASYRFRVKERKGKERKGKEELRKAIIHRVN